MHYRKNDAFEFSETQASNDNKIINQIYLDHLC